MVKVGYIPEHFSTPMFLALKKGWLEGVEFKPFPSGSGHLIQCLTNGEIDIAVGLTEAFVRAIAAGNEAYKIVGCYVQSPLRWAISTGAHRDDLPDGVNLEGKKCGVSRIGSGSDVMARVLALKRKYGQSFEFVVNHTFAQLRDGVNHTGDAKECDFFMWEHFTTKKYWDLGEIKRIGEIFTPWPSWVVTARSEILSSESVKNFIDGITKGIQYFNENPEEAIEWITSNLDYGEEDARAWLSTVKFGDPHHIDPEIISETVKVLKIAANLPEDAEKLTYTL